MSQSSTPTPLDYSRLKVGEPCYRCGKVISAPLSHMCQQPRRESRNEAAQIRNQYLAIAYLARQIAHVHEQLSRVSWSLPASVCGPDSAARLETLANICNAMDIVEKEDDWVNPILLKAHEMYPQAFTQSEIRRIDSGTEKPMSSATLGKGNADQA